MSTNRNDFEPQPIRVQAPHSYDGIGQALRAAYRHHEHTPDMIVGAIRRLETID